MNGQASRCIVVLGTGRSGTSAVAGALERMGISMGLELIEASIANPKGAYEDAELSRLNRRLERNTVEPDLEALSLHLRRRRRETWGIKDPMLCYTWKHVRPLLGEYRIIHVWRPIAQVIQSAVKYYNWKNPLDARAHFLERRRQIDSILAAEDPQRVLEVGYLDLLQDPREVLSQVGEFALGKGVDEEGLCAAIEFVDPSLCRIGSAAAVMQSAVGRQRGRS